MKHSKTIMINALGFANRGQRNRRSTRLQRSAEENKRRMSRAIEKRERRRARNVRHAAQQARA